LLVERRLLAALGGFIARDRELTGIRGRRGAALCCQEVAGCRHSGAGFGARPRRPYRRKSALDWFVSGSHEMECSGGATVSACYLLLGTNGGRLRVLAGPPLSPMLTCCATTGQEGPVAVRRLSPRTVDTAPIAPTVERRWGTTAGSTPLRWASSGSPSVAFVVLGAVRRVPVSLPGHERHLEMAIRAAGHALGRCRSNSGKATVSITRVHQSWWAAKNAQSSLVASAARLGWSCGPSSAARAASRVAPGHW
jgi:hypothetical protein